MSRPTWIPIALLGILSMCALYYPGHLNGDSKWQMAQAISGQFNTHHPVIMAYVWHFLIPILPGSGSIFLFHGIAYWLGMAWLLEERMATLYGRALGVLACTFYIPLSVAFFTIVKDTGLAAMMVLATGAFIRYERTREAWIFVIAILALVYACHVRHNGMLATLPYFLWAGHLLSARKWRAAAVGMALVVMVPWRLYEQQVIKPIPGRESQIPMLYDIVAISIAKNESYVPEFYSRGQPPLQVSELRLLYDPNSSLPLFWPSPSIQRHLGWLSSDREWTILSATWLAVIASEPTLFIAHRLYLSARLLGFNQPYYWPYWLPPDSELADMKRWNKPAQEAITHWIGRHDNWIIFRAWFYLLAIFLLAFLAFQKERKQSWGFMCVLASVFFYEGGLCLMAVDSDFRFSFWAMFAATILPLIARFSPPSRLQLEHGSN